MPEARCAAVILAAGASTRLGQAKQLMAVGGESLLRRTARCALEAGCAPVAVVVGFEAKRMGAELRGLAVEMVVHPEWAEGMGSSVRCGVASLFGDAGSGSSEPGALGASLPANVLLLVCDQPRLTAEHLRALLERHAAGGAAITASRYGGRPGVPAVFTAAVVPELLQCTGDEGARAAIRREAGRVQAVDWPEGAVDVDAPEDLEFLKKF